MGNRHRKRWAYDRRTRKWINLNKVSMFDLFNGRYDFEPNGCTVPAELIEKLRPRIEEWKATFGTPKKR